MEVAGLAVCHAAPPEDGLNGLISDTVVCAISNETRVILRGRNET